LIARCTIHCNHLRPARSHGISQTRLIGLLAPVSASRGWRESKRISGQHPRLPFLLSNIQGHYQSLVQNSRRISTEFLQKRILDLLFVRPHQSAARTHAYAVKAPGIAASAESATCHPNRDTGASLPPTSRMPPPTFQPSFSSWNTHHVLHWYVRAHS
jgi:hypothetical protein